MPTDERIRGAIVEVAEALKTVGYDIDETRGPVTPDGETIDDDEVEGADQVHYYLIGQGHENVFFILFDSKRQHGVVVYPFNILKHLGGQLTDDEVDAILGNEVDWEAIADSQSRRLHTQAAEAVVENTSPDQYYKPAFNLSIYASTSIVDFQQTQTEGGFPSEFQTTRAIFPYTEQMSPARVDDRVEPVIIAGERGRRYVDYSFAIDKSDQEPQNYQFSALF